MSEINYKDNMLGLMLDIRQDIDNFNGRPPKKQKNSINVEFLWDNLYKSLSFKNPLSSDNKNIWSVIVRKKRLDIRFNLEQISLIQLLVTKELEELFDDFGNIGWKSQKEFNDNWIIPSAKIFNRYVIAKNINDVKSQLIIEKLNLELDKFGFVADRLLGLNIGYNETSIPIDNFSVLILPPEENDTFKWINQNEKHIFDSIIGDNHLNKKCSNLGFNIYENTFKSSYKQFATLKKNMLNCKNKFIVVGINLTEENAELISKQLQNNGFISTTLSLELNQMKSFIIRSIIRSNYINLFKHSDIVPVYFSPTEAIRIGGVNTLQTLLIGENVEEDYMILGLTGNIIEDVKKIIGDNDITYYYQKLEGLLSIVVKITNIIDEKHFRLKRPTHHDIIESLDIVPFSEDIKNLSCCFCLEDFKNEDKIVRLPCNTSCNGYFHFDCNDGGIKKWLENSNSCPLCRDNFKIAKSKPSKFRMNSWKCNMCGEDDNYLNICDNCNSTQNINNLYKIFEKYFISIAAKFLKLLVYNKTVPNYEFENLMNSDTKELLSGLYYVNYSSEPFIEIFNQFSSGNIQGCESIIKELIDDDNWKLSVIVKKVLSIVNNAKLLADSGDFSEANSIIEEGNKYIVINISEKLMNIKIEFDIFRDKITEINEIKNKLISLIPRIDIIRWTKNNGLYDLPEGSSIDWKSLIKYLIERYIFLKGISSFNSEFSII
jgi:hypothetical protein